MTGGSKLFKKMAAKRTVQSERNCPDFELAPLEGFPPEIFAATGYSRPDAFILTLSLAFNDLKAIQWTVYQVDKCGPPSEDVTAETGQWMGMQLSMTRLTVLILHEVLNAIKEARKLRTLDDKVIQAAIARMPRSSVKSWRNLLELAFGGASSAPVRKYLEEVRHNFAAHYYQPKALFKGYQQFFFTEPKQSFNAAAMASFGDEVETTRFYFADAAVQAGQKIRNPTDAFSKEVHAYVLAMFRADFSSRHTCASSSRS